MYDEFTRNFRRIPLTEKRFVPLASAALAVADQHRMSISERRPAATWGRLRRSRLPQPVGAKKALEFDPDHHHRRAAAAGANQIRDDSFEFARPLSPSPKPASEHIQGRSMAELVSKKHCPSFRLIPFSLRYCFAKAWAACRGRASRPCSGKA